MNRRTPTLAAAVLAVPAAAFASTATATIYGSVPAGQNVQVSTNSDSVTMTIDF